MTSWLYLILTCIQGLTSQWLKPQKVSFLLQSFWVLYAMLTPQGIHMHVADNLPSVLAGWGGFFLGIVPPGAIVAALKAAAASAAVTGAAVGTVEGVKLGRKKMQHTTVDEGESLESVSNAYKQMFSAEGLKEYLQTWGPFFKSYKENRTDFSIEEQPDEEIELVDEETIKDVQEEVKDTGFELKSLNPPVPIAAAVMLFRTLPTCITLMIGVTSIIVNAMRGRFKIGMLGIPLTMLPLAISELIVLVRKVGVRQTLRGGFTKAYQNHVSEKYDDGMSIILWQSPTMLNAWTRAVSLDDNKETLMEDIKQAPRAFFNPDEETMSQTPPLTKHVLTQLVFSVIIDAIGSSSYAVPGLGELTDLIWAPISGFMLHRMVSYYFEPRFVKLIFTHYSMEFHRFRGWECLKKYCRSRIGFQQQ